MEQDKEMTRWEKYSDSYKEYYQQNKLSILEKNKEWKNRNPHKFLYNSAKQRAKREGIPFDITLDDLVVPTYCPILNKPLEFGTRYAPSVDRIDNAFGYVSENVWVISMQANRMKNDATLEELQAFCSNLMKTRPELDDRWNKRNDKQSETGVVNSRRGEFGCVFGSCLQPGESKQSCYCTQITGVPSKE